MPAGICLEVRIMEFSVPPNAVSEFAELVKKTREYIEDCGSTHHNKTKGVRI